MPNASAIHSDFEVTSSGAPLSASRTRTAVPNHVSFGTLDRYSLVSPLGRGGMAEVFLASWQVAPHVHRPVVIKRLYDHFGDDPTVLQMFIDEARLVCLLEHESIVKTHEVGIIGGQCCIVMEYLAGQPLQRIIRRTWNCGGIPIELAVQIGIRVLEGLEYAHDARDSHGQPLEIVHRDISPHNIFVTNSGLVKVLDFGIAKAKSHEGRTSGGLIKGKFAYLAPEQAGNRGVDRRADIWSTGVVLWEMLSGTRLFKADNDAATLRATLEAPIPAASALRSEVHPELDRILWRALQRNPHLRYQNATEMKLDLRDYLIAARCEPDKAALANLIRAHFSEEILEQRRAVYALLDPNRQRQDIGADWARAPDTPMLEGNSTMTAEIERIGGLMQELTTRHRTVLQTLLISLFVFVAVTAFLVVMLLARLSRQNSNPMLHNATSEALISRPALAPTPASSAVVRSSPSPASAASLAQAAAASASPSTVGTIAPALGDWVVPAATSSAGHVAPTSNPRPSQAKKPSPLHNYGI